MKKWISFGTSHASATPAPVAVQQPPIISAADAKTFGFENFGNTCYANSVLQALYFCGPFRELLLQYPDPSVPDLPPLPPAPPVPPPLHTQQPSTSSRKRPVRSASVSEASSANPNAPPPVPIPPQPPTLLSALRSLFLHISKNPADKGTVAPRAFIDKLKELNELFRPSMHQDAHEFLNYVLNQIIEEMEADGQKPAPHPNGVEKSGEDLSTSIATLSTQPAASTSTAQGTQFHSTIVHRLFEGVLTSETRCLTCETVSSRDESFIDLSIDIEQNSSVTACLRQFSASEMLCQKNKFFCDSCCDLQEAEKRMKIKKLPNILALHLKRFKIQEDVGKYIKLAYRVAFPIELRLFNTVDDAEDPDRLYELFAIVVHIGNGPYHGHYVTIVKTRGAWTLFDDDTVSTVKEADIPKYFGDSNSGSAYVLYYQAVDLDLPALGLKSPTPPLDPATAADITYVPVPVSLATAEPSELSHAPSSPFLHKPPGLNPSVDDLNVSDMSESPMLTPGTAPLMSSNHNTSDSLPVAAPTPLYPHMHIPDEPLIPSPSSPTHKEHGSRTLGKALRSLRHPPSLRLKTPNGHKNDYQRSSTVDSHGGIIPPLPASPRTRRPQTTGSTATASTADNSTHDTIPSVPPSPVPPKAFPFPNGSHSSTTKDKERTPEKKSNGWFRRKSTRAETGPLAPASPRLTRRGSEAAMSDAYSPVVPPTPLPPLASTAHTEPPPSPSAHKKAVPDVAKSLRREKRGSTNPSSKLPPRPSTAGAEMTSSSRGFGSSSIGMPPPLPPLPLPASPPSPPPAHRTQAADAFPPLVPPQGKGKEKGVHGTPDGGGSPLRPSRPLPLPLPLPNGDPAEWELRPNRQAQPTPPPVRISHSDSQYSSTTTTTTYHSHPHHSHWTLPHPPGHSHAETAPPLPPLAAVAALSFGGTGGGGVGDTPVVVSPATAQSDGGGGGGAGPGPGPGHNWRRATRKLSFTAPILGFGRKERERKGPPPPPPPPPSSYAR